MAELRSTIQSVYNVTDGNSMVAYNLVVDHQVHAGALMSNDDQIVVQLNKTVGDVVEQLAFNSDTLTAAYATSGSTGLVWNISGTTALLKCASGAAWKNEDIIISATINNIVVDKERISYSSSTPILELSNDVGSLMYSADGATKLKNDEVATTSATIYVNGNAVPTAQVQFNWNIIDGAGTSSANTVTVSAINLNAFKAQAVCTATFNGGSYQKSFDIMRNTQGVNGKPGTDGEPGADANVIEVFDIYFWRDLETAKTDILPSVPSDRSSIADSDTVAKDNWTTKIPTKATNRLIYHSVVTWTKEGTTETTLVWAVTNPTLILAYDSNNMQSPESYAQYLSLTNFDQNDALGWVNGKLIIRAEYIQSKGILVKNGEDVVFAAGGDGEYAHSAKIGGFTVDKNSLYNGTTDDSLIFLSTGRSEKYTIAGHDNVSNLMIKAGSNFGVTKDGTVYAGAAFITGIVNAEKGKIGGWTIDSEGLTYGNTVGVYGTNTWFYADTNGFPTEQAWIQRSASSPDSNLRFWAGVYSKQGVSNPILADGNYLHFCVTNNGTLYADQAFISGTIKATGGQIGTDGGVLYIDQKLSAGGEADPGTPVELTGSYFLYDKNQKLQLANLRLGLADNCFYIGRAGLVLRNPNFDSTIAPTGVYYDGCRLTASGFQVSGTNRTVGGWPVLFINGNGLLFRQYKYTDETWQGSPLETAYNVNGSADAEIHATYDSKMEVNDKQKTICLHISAGTGTYSYLDLYSGSDYKPGQLRGNWNVTRAFTVGGTFTAKGTTTFKSRCSFQKGGDFSGNMSLSGNLTLLNSTNNQNPCLTITHFRDYEYDRDLLNFNGLTDPQGKPMVLANFQWIKGDGTVYFCSSTHDIGLMTYKNDHSISLSAKGTITTNQDIKVISCRAVKQSIQPLTTAHSLLFDNLQPRIFQYKNGSSGRYHYGYIVDELRSAIDAAGFSTTECAAYCLDNPNDPDGTGGIRYSELSVLTTAEVQKLKPRVSDLEQRCIILEARIKELEEKYENIQ